MQMLMCQEVKYISLVSMKKYFSEVVKTYDIHAEEGWKKYITKMMWV